MGDLGFDGVITTESELRDVYRMPSDVVFQKVLGHLDQHARTFIEARRARRARTTWSRTPPSFRHPPGRALRNTPVS